MAFTPRTFSAIVSELVAWLLGSPEAAAAAPDMDLNVGSIERSHLEALAVQVEELEVRTAQAVLLAIGGSCYRAFGFDPLPASSSFGSVVFTALSPVVNPVSIPSGTRLVSVSGQIFQTTADAQIPAGGTVTAPVPVQAVASGSAGNVPAYTVTRMVAPIPGLDLVTNPGPMLGGAEVESDEARQARFIAYVRTLQRGTAEALEYAALSVSSVQDARVVEPGLLDPRPAGVPYAGTVWAFCDDGAGLTDATKAQVLQFINGYVDASGDQIPGWKAAGIRVDVLPASIVNVCVRGIVKLAPGGSARWDAIQATLTDTVTRYFESVRIGDPVSYQILSADLNTADDDVLEVDLFLWQDGSAAPDYLAVPSAADFSAVDALADPLSVGSRCVMKVSSLYPEWVLG